MSCKPTIIMIMLSFMMITLTMISRQQHVLPALLCLEGLILLLMYLLPSTSNNQLMMMNPSIIIMLTMSVSSASIGLAMLVVTSRKEGNDSTTSHSTYSC